MKTYIILILCLPFLSFTPPSLTNCNIVGDGNSYMQGNGYTPALTYIAAMAPFSTNGSDFTNFGVGGQTTTAMLADQASQVFPAFVPGVTNFLLVEEGGNDLATYTNVTAAVNNIKTYCNNARAYASANGIELYIIVSTKIRRNQSGNFASAADFNAAMVSFNTVTVADNSGAWDYVIRPDLQAIFSSYGAGGYDADNVHPNATGQQKYAEMYITAINYLTAAAPIMRGKKAFIQ